MKREAALLAGGNLATNPGDCGGTMGGQVLYSTSTLEAFVGD